MGLQGGGTAKGSKGGRAGEQASKISLKRTRGLLRDPLRDMMYGYGDDSDPLPETVLLVEDILVEYITDMTHKAQELSSRRGQPTTQDIMFLIRKDFPKLARAKEILYMQKDLKAARKQFELDEFAFSS